MGVLAEPLRRLSEYLNIEQYAKEGRYPIGVTGCVDSQKGHFIANLGRRRRVALSSHGKRKRRGKCTKT